MRVELGLIAVACLLTHKAIPESELIYPALGFLSAAFFSDPLIELVLIGVSCALWLLAERQ